MAWHIIMTPDELMRSQEITASETIRANDLPVSLAVRALCIVVHVHAMDATESTA